MSDMSKYDQFWKFMENNMIENKNNLGDMAYIPMGVKKIAKIAKMADELKKKSYLEKR